MLVRMFNPKTLQEAYFLAKLQEALRQWPGGPSLMGGKGVFNKNSGVITGAHTGRSVFMLTSGEVNKNVEPSGVVKRPLSLTPRQMEEKRSKNLCF